MIVFCFISHSAQQVICGLINSLRWVALNYHFLFIRSLITAKTFVKLPVLCNPTHRNYSDNFFLTEAIEPQNPQQPH